MYTKIIAYLLSKLSLGLGLALLVPFTFAVLNDEHCFIDFLFAMMFAGTLYLALGFYGKDANRKDISVREGIGTVFFAWVLATVIAALPFVFSGILDPVSAFFESMSGLTTLHQRVCGAYSRGQSERSACHLRDSTTLSPPHRQRLTRRWQVENEPSSSCRRRPPRTH